MTSAERSLVLADDTPATASDKRPSPLADVPLLPSLSRAAIAHTLQQDGAAVGLMLDDAVAAEVADALFDALRDDEEAAVDLASLVYDTDVRRVLAG